MEVDWITSGNGRLETVSSDRVGVQLHDINSADGKVLKIPMPGSTTEYFLLANRQNRYSEVSVGSYYDDYAPARGLFRGT